MENGSGASTAISTFEVRFRLAWWKQVQRYRQAAFGGDSTAAGNCRADAAAGLCAFRGRGKPPEKLQSSGKGETAHGEGCRTDGEDLAKQDWSGSEPLSHKFHGFPASTREAVANCGVDATSNVNLPIAFAVFVIPQSGTPAALPKSATNRTAIGWVEVNLKLRTICQSFVHSSYRGDFR